MADPGRALIDDGAATTAAVLAWPLLTDVEAGQLAAARAAGLPGIDCSLDLQLTRIAVAVAPAHWGARGQIFPYPSRCRPRTIYGWNRREFVPLARYDAALTKLVPTSWGAPTFEIDGIKMLPTISLSPFADAERKVSLVRPRGKVVLDTCGGLGYFAAGCLRAKARHIYSFEKSADVLWLRALNPWSPAGDHTLTLVHQDITQAILQIKAGSIDVILHDPPRFATAGALYAQEFYDHLARVIVRRGRCFHYTGAPNKSRGRDLAGEVLTRLGKAGFAGQRIL
ncbi:MAG: MnmC family methyltransferase, partial [Pseudomonadota bacterium]|nr:MnmC family methyltransferase [Pseudomonadota bacterium]